MTLLLPASLPLQPQMAASPPYWVRAALMPLGLTLLVGHLPPRWGARTRSTARLRRWTATLHCARESLLGNVLAAFWPRLGAPRLLARYEVLSLIRCMLVLV